MVTTSAESQRLAREAAQAAEIRDWRNHPDVIALRVERVRSRIDRMIWTGIILGLLFTMTSVQQFAARAMSVGPGTLAWWAAWLLDPTVAIILLAILLAERQIAPAQMRVGARAHVAKWGLLAATYTMNTWESWASKSAAGIVLHSVPVLAVFAAAESVTDCQDKLTAFVLWAHTAAAERAKRKATGDSVRDALAADITAMDARFDFEAGLADVYARAGRERPGTTPAAPSYPAVAAPPAPPAAETPAPSSAPAVGGRREIPAGDAGDSGRSPGQNSGRSPAKNSPARPAPPTADDVRPLAAEGLGRREIARRLNTTEHHVRRAIEAMDTAAKPALRAIGGKP